MIAASNLLEKLDPALLRPGRFDRHMFVSPPDVIGRARILDAHSRNKPVAEDVNYKLLARQTAGLTGADLANLCNEAAINAARRKMDTIGMADFDHALERVVAGMQSRRQLTERERRVVAFHEAGHAVCAELLPSVDPVHRISIVPRGRALGYTLNLPEEDRYLRSRAELIDMMTMLLGGRAAEQLVFGSITNGAADDLRRVADIAYAMVHDYAMGTQITSLRVEHAALSETTRRVRDQEVSELADEAFRAAVELLSTHRPRMDELAGALLENEVVEREEIEGIMADVPLTRPDQRAGIHLGLAAASVNRSSPPPATERPGTALGIVRGAMLSAIDHVGVAVENIDAALEVYRDRSGWRSSTARRSPSRASTRRCSTSATATSSCSAPLGPDTAVGKFLHRRGPGLHHVAYRVASVQGRSTPAPRPACA